MIIRYYFGVGFFYLGCHQSSINLEEAWCHLVVIEQSESHHKKHFKVQLMKVL